jgi:anti-sigma factor RsiW
MNREEAKRVLQVHRPDDVATAEADFAEALALAEVDPELKTWWTAEQAFDEKVTAKLSHVSPPSDLRAKILAGRKIVPFAPQPRFSVWLAAAAALAILCVVGTTYHVSWEATRHISTANYDEAALGFLGNDAPALGMTSPDHDKIMAWLKQQNAPMGDVPSKMADLPGVGCQKFAVGGHDVSLMCFMLATGRVVHLFVIPQDALSDPPSRSAPDFRDMNGWSTASWSDGRMSYMLATQAGPDALRQLL